MKIYKFIILIILIDNVILLPNSFGATAKTIVIIPEQSIITSINSTTKLTLKPTNIQKSISDNQPLKTGIIANACIFTANPDGDYGFTITADQKFMQNKNFALYNQSLGKITVNLFLFSMNDPKGIEFKPNLTKSLTEHSDNESGQNNCINRVKFYLVISVAELRKAKPGTYYFSFNTYTSTSQL